jgi:uncharacterized protein (TIGR02001 family)
MPAIGAHIFCVSNHLYSIICLLKINFFGTHSAVSCVRKYSSPLVNLTIKEIIMMKSKLLNTMILAALAVPGVAMAADAAPAPTPLFTANVALVSDYLYRGISQSGGKPAIQGGFDYAHSSGFYAGVWGSSISWLGDSIVTTVGAAGATQAGLELDTYLGFKNSFAGDFNYDVGFLRYNYPGIYVPGSTKADTNEIYGLIGWKWITLKYSDSLGDTFGVKDASGTSYIDLSASYTLEGSGLILGAHYGQQKFKGSTADAAKNTYTAGVSQDPSYTDYNVSVSKDFGGYVWGLKYSDTDAEKGGAYTATAIDGSTVDLGKSTVVLSVLHSF